MNKTIIEQDKLRYIYAIKKLLRTKRQRTVDAYSHIDDLPNNSPGRKHSNVNRKYLP